MNIKEQKTELNKKDIYENVRKDINRRQTVHSNKSANYRSGTPEMPDRRKKVYSSYDHYYHNDSNTARIPTHNHHLYLKRLLEYHNTEHDYKLQGLTSKAEDETREWDATERNDKVEGGEEKSQIGRLRGERPEYETENWWIQTVVERRYTRLI